MTRAAVVEQASVRVKSSQEKRRERRSNGCAAKLAIHCRDYHVRLQGIAMNTQQTQKETSPHPRREAFSADIAESEHCLAAVILNGDEVAGQVPGRECFAGNFEVAVPYQTGTAKS